MSAICQGNISQVKVPRQLKINKLQLNKKLKQKKKQKKNFEIKTTKTFNKIKMKAENVKKKLIQH